MQSETQGYRRRLFLTLGISIGAVVLAASNFRAEPKYDGKPISKWFVAWARDPNARTPPAFAHLGSNSVPYLVGALSRHDSIWDRSYQYVYDALPDSAQSRLRRPLPASTVRWKAARALRELGPHARAALPALGEALTDPESRVRYNAMSAIASIGPESRILIPQMIQALEIPDNWSRFQIARAVLRMENYPDEIVPPLVDVLSSLLKECNESVGDPLTLIEQLKPILPETIRILFETVKAQDELIGPDPNPRLNSAIELRKRTVQLLAKFIRANPSFSVIHEQAKTDPDPQIRAIAEEIDVLPLQ